MFSQWKENHWLFHCENISWNFTLRYYLNVRISKAVIPRIGALAFHQSVKMHISKTLTKYRYRSVSRYFANIVGLLLSYRNRKKWYRSLTTVCAPDCLGRTVFDGTVAGGRCRRLMHVAVDRHHRRSRTGSLKRANANLRGWRPLGRSLLNYLWRQRLWAFFVMLCPRCGAARHAVQASRPADQLDRRHTMSDHGKN